MLHQRISDAESRAASASERDRLASDRAQTLAARLSGAEGALQAGRDEVRSLEAQLEAALQRCGMAEERARVANHQIELMQERRALMEKQQEEVRIFISSKVAAGETIVNPCLIFLRRILIFSSSILHEGQQRRSGSP